MLHACVERFDVMCVRGNILGWEGEVNEAIAILSHKTGGGGIPEIEMKIKASLLCQPL
jgi:hypothetical protein